jgi:hypothetical protein
MEDTKETAGTQLSVDQVGAVSGGDGSSCTTTVTVTTPVGSITSGYNSFGDALIGTYDGIVAATSHVIETVATAAK